MGWCADQDSVIWNREGTHDRRTQKNERYDLFDNRKGKTWTVRQHHYLFKYTFWCVSFSLLDTLVRLTLLVTVTANSYKYTRNSNNITLSLLYAYYGSLAITVFFNLIHRGVSIGIRSVFHVIFLILARALQLQKQDLLV